MNIYYIHCVNLLSVYIWRSTERKQKLVLLGKSLHCDSSPLTHTLIGAVLIKHLPMEEGSHENLTQDTQEVCY